MQFQYKDIDESTVLALNAVFTARVKFNSAIPEADFSDDSGKEQPLGEILFAKNHFERFLSYKAEVVKAEEKMLALEGAFYDKASVILEKISAIYAAKSAPKSEGSFKQANPIKAKLAAFVLNPLASLLYVMDQPSDEDILREMNVLKRAIHNVQSGAVTRTNISGHKVEVVPGGYHGAFARTFRPSAISAEIDALSELLKKTYQPYLEAAQALHFKRITLERFVDLRASFEVPSLTREEYGNPVEYYEKLMGKEESVTAEGALPAVRLPPSRAHSMSGSSMTVSTTPPVSPTTFQAAGEMAAAGSGASVTLGIIQLC